MGVRLSSFLLLIIFAFFPSVILSEPLVSIIAKSPLDDREYASFTLDNGLKVVVVSDKASPTAGAAIVVWSGLYDDPSAFPGLAHFLEHMLFLGTQRYPVPDEFQNFIQSYGGDRNAMTEGEKTTFFFSIQPEAFDASLDRFADFFVAPALYPAYIDRELNAVEQEFHLYLHKDNWAAMEVNKETSHPKHPFFHYFGGNKETLGKDKEALSLALKTFFETHYHAQNMTLALVGPQPIDVLKQYAQTHFSKIAKMPQHHKKDKRTLMYTEAELGVDIYMQAKGQAQELIMTFPLPHERDRIKRQSKQLVAVLLNSEGKGGLSSILKKREWIIEAQVDYESLSEEQDAIMLSFSLTDDGRKHINELTRYVFSAVELIRKKGVPVYFPNEIKNINRASFLYMEKQEAASLAQALAENMRHMPTEALLTGNFLLPNDRISEEAIQEVLSQLKPQNMRRLIVSPQEKGDKQSKWYKASYRVEKITPEKMQRLATPYFLPGLSMPEENRFIPTDLTLAGASDTTSLTPMKIRDNKITLWHHQDTIFQQPKGMVYVHFNVPWLARSRENTVLAKIYVNLLTETLKEEYYAAALAGTSISFTDHPRGITLAISGYTDKQKKLLEEVLHSIQQFKVKKNVFYATRDTLIRRIKNFDQRTLLEKAHAELSVLLLSPTWHPVELLPVGEELSFEEMIDFQKMFWEDVSVEMLVCGNYQAAQAQTLATSVENHVPLKVHARQPSTELKIVELPPGSKYYRKIADTQSNHVVMWYIQNPVKDYDTVAKTLILSNLIEVPYYQTLRVDKQLAYSLGASAYSLRKSSGLMFWIQSSQADSARLLGEIQSFLKEFKSILGKMSEDEYLAAREALIYQLSEPPRTLDEQVGRWWEVIENGDLDFHYNEKMVKVLEKIDQKTLATFLAQILEKQPGQLLVLSEGASLLTETEIVSINAFREHMANPDGNAA